VFLFSFSKQYPADGTPQSPQLGATDVANRITSQSKACPDQKFALVGYSQGASVVRRGTLKLDKALLAKIVAIANFGDLGQRDPSTATNARPAPPQFPTELLPKVKLNCAKGDPACDNAAGSDFGPHLTYNKAGTAFQADSAKFIVAGFKGEALPKVNNNPV
jgi:hypothetical protein